MIRLANREVLAAGKSGSLNLKTCCTCNQELHWTSIQNHHTWGWGLLSISAFRCNGLPTNGDSLHKNLNRSQVFLAVLHFLSTLCDALLQLHCAKGRFLSKITQQTWQTILHKGDLWRVAVFHARKQRERLWSLKLPAWHNPTSLRWRCVTPCCPRT